MCRARTYPTWFAVCLAFLAFPACLSAVGEDLELSVERLISDAGNADDDEVRLEILQRLGTRTDLDPNLRDALGCLTAVVQRWVHDPQLYQWFDRPIQSELDYDFGVGQDSLLYPITCIYRGRMLVWTANESGNILGYHDQRRRFFDRAVEQFTIAHKAFPENRIVRMYLGEPFPPTKEYAAVPGAPQWAVWQRESLERLTDIVLWWIEHRLQPDGQYGGGWDDDCEMWRSWVPVMIAFEHPRITEAQAFFSQALLSQEYMRDGYTRHVYDVEHTAEPSSDTITPMMHLAPDDPAWRERATRLADLMETLWTGRNERGQLQFKSTYFSAQRVDSDPVRACDTPYHVRAMEPALVLWLRTDDPRLRQLLTAWLDTWVDAAASAERGKPAGVIPAAIRWPSGEPAGPGSDWWDPQHHGEPRLYEWPSAVQGLTDALLLAHHMTSDERYLQPLRAMAAIRLEALESGGDASPVPGSRLWCGRKLGLLAGTLAKYKLLTGSHEFDSLLARDAAGSFAGGDDAQRSQLAESLRQTAHALAINFPGRTSEVRWTDRVFALARLFGDDMLFPEAKLDCSRRPDLELLYGTATGDRGNFRVFPLNAIRWLTEPRDLAALVTDRGHHHLGAQLFHFGERPRSMGAELYLLTPGPYTLTLADAEGQPVAASQLLEVTGPRTKIAFELPPRKLCFLEVSVRPE